MLFRRGEGRKVLGGIREGFVEGAGDGGEEVTSRLDGGSFPAGREMGMGEELDIVILIWLQALMMDGSSGCSLSVD